MLDRELVRGSTPSPDLQPEYLPMMLFAAWWNLVLDSWCPACPPCGRRPADHDFAVPKPIEEAGERALFA
ncbi:hypothetical protein DAH66_19650 [Sphingomonas koreensis]|jgi:hypothetical protein|uniref:Uncharacterized protein n=1 Tax=Sphingomonas koreensis TaxID=93064 RepID=A0A430FYN8_9SPHN|nr:hypothetical protein [Sphingomonas koreensis]MDC7808911.1 hypothetical protein [Sphingomonas koreensis]RSU99034.1 hypothetical protein CA256_03710 [Sphingomonas koreensis]RSY77915.1 hypothetical protein DAH66_19650 [Sphingomonas koreensis]